MSDYEDRLRVFSDDDEEEDDPFEGLAEEDDDGGGFEDIDFPFARAWTRDEKEAFTHIGTGLARYLVDAYYQEQRRRIIAQGQIKSTQGDPMFLLQHIYDQHRITESRIKSALDAYTDATPVGKWCKAQHGVGPVITAGLLAHINIEKATTAGRIWRFAGLDPTVTWQKASDVKDLAAKHKDQSIPDLAVTLANFIGIKADNLLIQARKDTKGNEVPLTVKSLVTAACRRPYNARLRVLSWKTSSSFVKFSGNPECFYGELWVARKQYEVQRNEAGGNAEEAARILQKRKFSSDTKARTAYREGKLPPAQLQARSQRWTVKLFLAHLHEVMWFTRYKELPVAPYALTHIPGHTHRIEVPHMHVVPGLAEAREAYNRTVGR